MERRTIDALLKFVNTCWDVLTDIENRGQPQVHDAATRVFRGIPCLPDLRDQAMALLIAADTLNRIASMSALVTNDHTRASSRLQSKMSTRHVGSQSNRHSHHPKVLRAVEVLERRFTEQRLRLSDISAEIGLSAPYLDRLFKEGTGVSVAAYLRQVRIERARQLLLNPSHSIKAIAFMVGFSQVATFDRTFKRLEGSTPTEWRNSKNAYLGADESSPDID
jgi:transcriptional regulator GlxA family with amidase domain